MRIEWYAGYYDVIELSIDKLKELFDKLVIYKFRRCKKFYWNQFEHNVDSNFQILKTGASYFISVMDYEKKINANNNINCLYYFNKNGTKCYLNSAEYRNMSGKDAYDYIASEFNDGHKLTIPKTFTISDEEMLNMNLNFNMIKDCVPKGVIYSEEDFQNQELSNCYKADVSSCYGSNLCKGPLPTLVDCKVVDGLAEPTEEYPFAFYLNSHNIKIYNELDTRDWKYDLYYQKLYYKKNNFVVNDNNITLLMKAADANFNDIFEDLYAIRKQFPEAKQIMNYFIGYCQKTSNPNLAHISAVVIARANQFILDKAHQLEEEGNVILNINIDSIMWQGNKSNVATDKKSFGSFTYEYDGKQVDIYYKGAKSYQIRDHKGVIDTKCSGMEKDDPRREIWKSISEVYIPEHLYDINLDTLEVTIF